MRNQDTNQRRKSFTLRAASLTMTVTAGFLVSSSSALAAPTLYPVANNRLAQVVNPSGAIVIGDSTNRNQLWVLPPQNGETVATGQSFSGNVGFCDSMAKLQSASERVVERIDDLSDELDAYEAQEDDAQAELSAAKQDLADLFVDDDPADAFEAMVEEIDALKDEIDEARERLDDCDEDLDECDPIKDEIDELKESRKERKRELRELRKEHREEYKAFRRAKKRVDSAQEDLEAVQERFDKKLGRYTGLKGTLDNMYAQYATLEGGFSNFAYDSGWNEDIVLLAQANPSFQVNPIPTKDARINMTLVPGADSANYLASLPMVLNYSIGGKSHDPADPVQEFDALPATISGTSRLSLVGSCPIAYPGNYDIEVGSTGAPVFSTVATYSFPTVVRFKAEVTYNMWSMYERIKKQWKKGGFFKSKSGSSDTENEDSDSSFSVRFIDEAGFSKAEQDEIIKGLKAEIQQEILTRMGTAVHDPNAPEIRPANTPPNGAIVFAKGVQSTCGFNIFCRGASWILRGLGATFGSSKAEASFKRDFNMTVTRTYSSTDMQYRPGMIGFSRSTKTDDIFDEDLGL